VSAFNRTLSVLFAVRCTINQENEETFMNLHERKSKRDEKIDNVRALAILLVVFGHSIILYQTSWTLFETSVRVPFLDTIKRVIDLIQMPLFISASGYLAYYSRSRYSFGELINKKIRRLIVPYYSISLLWLLPLRYLVGYSGYAGRSFVDVFVRCIICGEDPGHLWFLPFLFGSFIVFYFTKTVIEYLPVKELIKSVLLLLFGFLMHNEWWRIPQAILFGTVFRSIALYYVWFPFGYLINKYQYLFERLSSNQKCFVLFLGTAFAVTYITTLQSYSFITQTVMVIAVFLAIPNESSRISSFFANNSFGIYLFHSPLIYITFSLIPNSSPFIVVIINFLVFGGVAIALTALIKNSKLNMLIGE